MDCALSALTRLEILRLNFVGGGFLRAKTTSGLKYYVLDEMFLNTMSVTSGLIKKGIERLMILLPMTIPSKASKSEDALAKLTTNFAAVHSLCTAATDSEAEDLLVLDRGSSGSSKAKC